MRRSSFDDKRDQVIADTVVDPVDRVGRCSAHGCPNIWTTQSTKLCRWHSSAEPHFWPRVTEELNEAITQQAFDRQREVAVGAALTSGDKKALLAKMRTLFTTEQDPRAWAHALKARDDAGERLTPAQRTMYKAALRRAGHVEHGGSLDAAEMEKRKRETARRVAEYERKHP